MLKNWQKWVLEALAIIAVVVAVQLWQVRGLPEGPAPELAGNGLDSQPLSLAATVAAAKGKPVLVAFWATWCGVCKAEGGNLAAIAADTPFLSVAMQSGEGSAVAAYLAERGRSLPTINDPEGLLANGWQVRGVPSHFIVDGNGNVRFRVVGYATEWGLRARLWWAEKFLQ
ncbi:MAG TPA: protein disulfide oxidoreductase [Rhodocyclaceae bacterium]|nr:protein disulfide oxidoreductase [Rhodocyclaceae bacterium]